MSKLAYMQIVDELSDKRSELIEPLRLPHERMLAQKMKVGRDTVRRALAKLEKEGAVTRRRGRGTYLHPSKLGQGNNGLRSRNVGFVPPWWADSTSSWYTSTVFEGISRWADEHDSHISIYHADRHGKNEVHWMEMLKSRQTEGLIWVHPASEQVPLIEYCSKFVPSVVLGRCYKDRGLHHVIPDFDRIAEIVDSAMLENGHKEYTIVGASMMTAYSQSFIESFTRVHASRGSTFDLKQNFIDIKPFDRQQLAKLLIELYSPVHPNVHAFFLTSSSYLSPLLSSREFRQRMQKDISIIAFDFGLYPMNVYWPGHEISHISCNWPAMGRRGMEVLGMLSQGQQMPEAIIEPVNYVRGQTLKPLEI